MALAAEALTFTPLEVQPTCWQLTRDPTLNIAVDGCIVPCEAGARVDYAHLVVLDDFLDETVRLGLLDFLTQSRWQGAEPPDDKWSRSTVDSDTAARTWGINNEVLEQFMESHSWAKLEVQSRLCNVYPDMQLFHMPCHAIQHISALYDSQHAAQHHDQEQDPQTQQQAGKQGLQQQQQLQQQQDLEKQLQLQQTHQRQHQEQQQQPEQQHHGSTSSCLPGSSSAGTPSAPTFHCTPFIANAAVHGDSYSWHVDADPTTFPPSLWTLSYGSYCNRDPGKPLLFSLLLYLDAEWSREWDAETLFLDTQTDTGVLVRPRRYRAVLLDQDVTHRLSPPSKVAQRPRYSLVWKLLMLPKTPGATCSLARPEWAPPTYFGSAARVHSVARRVAADARGAQKES